MFDANRLNTIAGFLRETESRVAEWSKTEGAWDVKANTPWGEAHEGEILGPDGDSWPSDVHMHPVALASLYLMAATAHLANLGVLLEGGGLLLTPEVVVRVVVELSNRIWWLLPKEEGARVRVARAELERLYLAQDALVTFARLTGRADGSLYRQLKEGRERTLEEVRSLFAADEVDVDLGRATTEWRIIGESIPSPTSLTEDLLEFAGLGGPYGEGVYGLLSGYSHPNAVQLSLRLADVPGSPQAQAFTVDDEYLRNVISAALSAFHRALRQLSAYVGWSRESFEEWQQRLEEVLPELFEGEEEQ